MFAGAFGSVSVGSVVLGSVEFEAGLAAAVPVFAADGAPDFVLPLLPFPLRAADELRFAGGVTDDGALCCWVLLPLCVVAPEAFVPLPFPACDSDAAVDVVALLLSDWPDAPPEPVAPPDPCGAGAGLAGAEGGTLLLLLLFAGPVTPASSKAAKGWEPAFWLCAEAAAEAAAEETAVEALGAILGTLGT